MGNICRSPTAEGVFRKLVRDAGLEPRIGIDSAGTHGYHAGDPPDARSIAAATRRGYQIDHLRARQVSADDLRQFDYLLAMDRGNLASLRRIAPLELSYKARLFMEFSTRFADREVADPYYGGAGGFEAVLNYAEDAGHGLLAHIRRMDLGLK